MGPGVLVLICGPRSTVLLLISQPDPPVSVSISRPRVKVSVLNSSYFRSGADTARPGCCAAVFVEGVPQDCRGERGRGGAVPAAVSRRPVVRLLLQHRDDGQRHRPQGLHAVGRHPLPALAAHRRRRLRRRVHLRRTVQSRTGPAAVRRRQGQASWRQRQRVGRSHVVQ